MSNPYSTSGPAPRVDATRNQPQRPRKNVGWELAKVGAGGLVGLIIAACILQFGFGLDPLGIFPDSPKRNPSVADGVSPESDENDASSSEPKFVATPAKPAAPQVGKSKTTQPRKEPAVSPESSQQSHRAVDGPGSALLKDVPQKPLPGPPPVSREPVPDTTAVAAARAELASRLQVFGDIEPTKAAGVVPKLWQSAEKEGQSALRYVLLHRAVELSIVAGDASLVSLSVDQLAAKFELDDIVATKIQAVKQVADGDQVAINEFMRRLIQTSKQLIDKATEERKFDKALDLARTCAKATQDCESGEPYRAYVAHGVQFLVFQKTQWDRYQTARKTLTEDPQNAAAHEIVARWLCLQEGDWKGGLPHWAQGVDRNGKALAARDLSLESSPELYVQIADEWYAFAALDEGNQGCLARAYFWYEKALQNVRADGRKHVEDRLREISAKYNGG